MNQIVATVAELAAGVLGLDVIANVVMNSHREICGLFVGDFIQAHRKGAHFAMDTYSTEIPETKSDRIRSGSD